MKQFSIPERYRSQFITSIKQQRKASDKLKKDFRPTLLDLGSLQIYLSRHFGFCYGVENAIEIAFKTIAENPDRRIFLLSEMIHNPQVNSDLLEMGVQFLQDNTGKPLLDPDIITGEDIVLIPAFGTTLPLESFLRSKGIAIEKYNTTCPFVEKVWNRGEQIAAKGYSIVVHGKPGHEETRATFSHAAAHTPTVVINDMEEAIQLAGVINGTLTYGQFYTLFEGRYSSGFDPSRDLQRIGVINQTTQLATDTQAISDFLRTIMIKTHSLEEKDIPERFADTRDTLCYATHDNQQAVYGLLEQEADLALVVGGFNSSNTSHLVELCEQKLPVYFIDSEERIQEDGSIQHAVWNTKEIRNSSSFLPAHKPVRILITSGASCPDAVVERVIEKVARLSGESKRFHQYLSGFMND